MRTSIVLKISILLLFAVLFMVAITMHAAHVSQKISTDNAGKSAQLLARELFKRMDQNLSLTLDQLRQLSRRPDLIAALTESNLAFGARENLSEFMTQGEARWTAASPSGMTGAWAGVAGSPLSRELRWSLMDSRARQYGYSMIKEVILTNRHGANVAVSGKTTDYDQSDEAWWREARESGVHIGDIRFDESAGTFLIKAAIRVEGAGGDFTGVLSAGIDVLGLIRLAEITARRYETTRVHLITPDGKLIYSTKAFSFFSDVKDRPFYACIAGDTGTFIKKSGGNSRLYTYARSMGRFRDFGWIMIISHAENEVLAPYRALRNRIFAVSFLLILLIIAASFFLVGRITRNLRALTDGAKTIGRGDLEHRVRVESRDEIGELAAAFNHMVERRGRAEKEKEELHTRLRQKHKMEAIGTLAGGIAHDFNNILTAILGYGEMALLDLGPEHRATKMLGEVMKAGARARELVRRILAFSRGADEERISLDPGKLLEESLSLLRATIPSSVEIRPSEIPPDCHILANPTQVHQVLMNLCTNGAQAMEGEGGILAVGLTRVILTEANLPDAPGAKPGTYVCLSVEDNGEGIAPELMSRIFDPYFTTKAVGKGSGMGLAVVHGVMESHGGFSLVRSEKGKGTVFEVFFPEAEPAAEIEAPPSEPMPKGSGRVLVVDDEGAVAELNRVCLGSLGYTVTVQTDSRSALELFRTAPGEYDMVLTDQTMPGLTGTELISELRKVRPDIPVVVCTGFSDQVDERSAESMGIDGFLMKPVGLHDLALTVGRVMAQDCGKSRRG